MKTLIILSNVLFALCIGLLINRERLHAAWQTTERTGSEYTIPNIRYPSDFASSPTQTLILKGSKLIVWDNAAHTVLSSEEAEPNTVIDYDKGGFYLCEWENFEISDPSEFATVITWQAYEGEELQIPVNRTVKPVWCGRHRILATNAFPTLRHAYYEIHVSDGELAEVAKSDIDNQALTRDGSITVRSNVGNSLQERLKILLSRGLRKLAE